MTTLLDKLARARAPLVIVDAAGPALMPGAAERAPAVAACPLRYVLDADASDACRRSLEDPPALDAALVRLPATRFWLEWTEDDGRRTGLLVETDDGGRRGVVEAFWERGDEQPDRAQALLRFDLDRPIAAQADWRTRLALVPRAHRLAPHLLFEFDKSWMEHFQRAGQASAVHAVELVVSNLAPAFDLLLAFASLLQSRPPSAAAGTRRTRGCWEHRFDAALGNHIEARLDLLDGGRADRDAMGARGAGPARRHHVRGHLVRRGGRLFWRRAHLRGAADRPLAGKTVLVGSTRPS